jgi:hypothetical protein
VPWSSSSQRHKWSANGGGHALNRRLQLQSCVSRRRRATFAQSRTTCRRESRRGTISGWQRQRSAAAFVSGLPRCPAPPTTALMPIRSSVWRTRSNPSQRSSRLNKRGKSRNALRLRQKQRIMTDGGTARCAPSNIPEAIQHPRGLALGGSWSALSGPHLTFTASEDIQANGHGGSTNPQDSRSNAIQA